MDGYVQYIFNHALNYSREKSGMKSNQYIKIKEIDEFFEELLRKCQHKDCISIDETIKKMGVTYHEAKMWAKSNTEWNDTLELCCELCNYHAEKAGLFNFQDKLDLNS